MPTLFRYNPAGRKNWGIGELRPPKILRQFQNENEDDDEEALNSRSSVHWTKVQCPRVPASAKVHMQFHPAGERLGILHQTVTTKKPLIAIVDDDESVCRAMERLVRSLGMVAETYASSEDFLNQIESLPSFHLDCVILDVQMPGLNGIEVQTRLRRIHKKMPVISSQPMTIAPPRKGRSSAARWPFCENHATTPCSSERWMPRWAAADRMRNPADRMETNQNDDGRRSGHWPKVQLL